MLRKELSMFMSYQQNAGQNHNLKITNTSSVNVAIFTSLGATLINKYVFMKELRASCLLPKNINIEIYRSIILPAVLYW
jgi:hypothetical protein